MATHLITGVTGQDGVLLARSLVATGGRVVGTCRPGSAGAHAMAPYLDGVDVVPLDLRDIDGLTALIEQLRPDTVVNLAAMSSVGESWQRPEEALAVNGDAPVALIAALAAHPDARFLQAASAEESAGAADSPYARGKSRAHAAVAEAREQGRFACAARLHIHESPLRRSTFVVRKVTRAVAEIALGRRVSLTLGSLEVRRDWGSAVDAVRAMRCLLEASEPHDLEVASGVIHSLRDVVEIAFAAAAISDPWSHVVQDPSLVRPADTPELVGDPAPIRRILGWSPTRTLEDTITDMVHVDIERLRTGVEEDPAYLARTERGAA